MLLYSVVAPMVCMSCRSLVLVFGLRRIRSIRSGCVCGGLLSLFLRSALWFNRSVDDIHAFVRRRLRLPQLLSLSLSLVLDIVCLQRSFVRRTENMSYLDFLLPTSLVA